MMASKFLFLTFLLSQVLSAATIIVDPGHGGEDHGATYIDDKKNIIFEKDLALTYSKAIAEELRKKGHRVFLTRSLDRTVTLAERSELADKIKADLFISVHLNSSEEKNSRGFETYYLSNMKDAAIRKFEHEGVNFLEGKDPMVKDILLDLIFEKNLESSSKLGRSIHREISMSLKGSFQMKDRGLRPGLFYVLALAKRPAVLLEVGFLSNSEELKVMSSQNFQQAYALSVARGVQNYFK